MAAAPAAVDTSGDEELARRLQLEEAARVGGARRVAGSGVGSRQAQAHRAQQVVLAGAAQNQAAALARRSPRSDLRWTSAFLTLFTLPQLIAFCVVLATESDRSCDAALDWWVIINSGRMTIVLAVFWTLAAHQNTAVVDLPAVARIAQGLYQPLLLASWVWLVVGSLWLMGTEDCQSLAPSFFGLTLAMIILQFLWLFMPLIAFLLLAPFALCCFPCYMRMLRWLQLVEGRAPSQRGATDRQLRQVPEIRFTASKLESGEIPEECCAICLSDFTEGQSLRQPRCKHVFCKSCADTWFHLNATCPSCRQPVLASDKPDDADAGGAASAAVAGAGSGATTLALATPGASSGDASDAVSGPTSGARRLAGTSPDHPPPLATTLQVAVQPRAMPTGPSVRSRQVAPAEQPSLQVAHGSRGSLRAPSDPSDVVVASDRTGAASSLAQQLAVAPSGHLSAAVPLDHASAAANPLAIPPGAGEASRDSPASTIRMDVAL